MIEKSFSLTSTITLDCRFLAGSVTVRALPDSSQASVRISARANERVLEQFRVELTGDILYVLQSRDRAGAMMDNLFGRVGTSGVDVTVDLPAGSGLRVAVQSADIRTEGTLGATDLASGSATVQLAEIDGDLRVRGGSGDIGIERVTGATTIRGGSGSVRIRNAGRQLSVGLGSGDLHVGAAHGRVRMRSGSGGVTIGLADGDVDVTSGSGSVRVGLAAGRAARLDVLTGSGRLHTDMPVQAQAPAGQDAEPVTVRARTGAGDVTIQRADPSLLAAAG
ncbi:MAG TPA: DUF4097 family beta strand repeat-containing protein [Jatrophihabitans sp.]|nr:DUF4097 family beta strand repeat-containing protein [Jatrophihabitans sp.]